MRLKPLWLMLLLLAPLAALAAGDFLTVKLREASVRTGPKHFKPILVTLKYGEKVEVLDSKDGWLEVEFTFKTADRSATPTLKNFDIAFRCP